MHSGMGENIAIWLWKNHPYQVVWGMLSLLFLIVAIVIYQENAFLERENKPLEVLVVGKSCLVHSGSSLILSYNNKEYSIGYNSDKCEKIKKGTNISVFYSTKFDYFYLKGSLSLNMKYINAALLSLFLSILPWNKLILNGRSILEKYNR